MSKAPILIAETDPAIRGSLVFALEAEGLDIMVAGSMEAVPLAAQAREAACLILDHRPPLFDAVATLEQLRSMEITTPTIIISSTNTPRLRRRIAKTGASWIIKPLLGSVLISTVKGIARTPGTTV